MPFCWSFPPASQEGTIIVLHVPRVLQNVVAEYNSQVRHECPTTTKGPSSSAQTEYRVQHYAMDAMDESFKMLLKISRYNSFLSASCKRKYSSAKLLRQHLKNMTQYFCFCSKATYSRTEMTKRLCGICMDKSSIMWIIARLFHGDDP